MSLPCGCYSAESYPNRFIAELFRQLKISFITELRKCHHDWCENYRYDLYFECNNEKYIVETLEKNEFDKELSKVSVKNASVYNSCKGAFP